MPFIYQTSSMMGINELDVGDSSDATNVLLTGYSSNHSRISKRRSPMMMVPIPITRQSRIIKGKNLPAVIAVTSPHFIQELLLNFLDKIHIPSPNMSSKGPFMILNCLLNCNGKIRYRPMPNMTVPMSTRVTLIGLKWIDIGDAFLIKSLSLKL